jgi:hypothetical protein
MLWTRSKSRRRAVSEVSVIDGCQSVESEGNSSGHPARKDSRWDWIPASRASRILLVRKTPIALRINHAAFGVTTNHENILEKEVCWSDRQVDEGRSILARFEPEYEYDLDVDRHNELLPLSQDREHAEEFRQFAGVLR